MYRTTALESGILLMVFLVVALVVGMMFLVSPMKVPKIPHVAPTRLPVSAEEMEHTWGELVEALRAEDWAKADQLAKWLDAHKAAPEVITKTQAHLICAWCGKVIRESDTPQDSHGICDECADGWLKRAGE